MPELPEVETIKRTLEKKLKGLFFVKIEIFLPKIIKFPDSKEFQSSLTGKIIKKLKRRGKYLLFYLSENLLLITHLRMTGKLIYSPPDVPLKPHTHLIFYLNNGYHLRFLDVRQFGFMFLVPARNLEKVPGLSNLGPEPLEPDFTQEYLEKELFGRQTALKTLLLNQSFIAGIGNIYANEILYQARLHPKRLSNTLTPREVNRLFYAIQDILREAIAKNGTSIRDYVDGDGNAGKNILKVHNREEKPCLSCGKPVIKIRLGGRSTYFCPYCQKTK